MQIGKFTGCAESVSIVPGILPGRREAARDQPQKQIHNAEYNRSEERGQESVNCETSYQECRQLQHKRIDYEPENPECHQGQWECHDLQKQPHRCVYQPDDQRGYQRRSETGHIESADDMSHDDQADRAKEPVDEKGNHSPLL
jgi:hypothetical protein